MREPRTFFDGGLEQQPIFVFDDFLLARGADAILDNHYSFITQRIIIIFFFYTLNK